jgi:hypothetical protein
VVGDPVEEVAGAPASGTHDKAAYHGECQEERQQHQQLSVRPSAFFFSSPCIGMNTNIGLSFQLATRYRWARKDGTDQGP